MKQCKRLTRSQKELISKHKLNPKNWTLQKQTELSITVKHKDSGKTRDIYKT